MQPPKLWPRGYRFVGALTLVVMLDPTGSSAEGQSLKPLRAGDRVRITRASAVPAVVRTRLVLLDQRSVIVHGGDVDTMMVFPSRSIVRFELSRGKHPALTFGAPVLGALLGAALGPSIITENPRCTSGVGIVEACAKEIGPRFRRGFQRRWVAFRQTRHVYDHARGMSRRDRALGSGRSFLLCISGR